MATPLFNEDELRLIAKRWPVVRRYFHNQAIALMVGTIDCGPFDGGCVIVARALQSIIGGEIHVLVSADDQAEHAVVDRVGLLWDYGGPTRLKSMMIRHSIAGQNIFTGCRPMTDGDLLEAAWNSELEADLAEAFRLAFKAFLTTHRRFRRA